MDATFFGMSSFYQFSPYIGATYITKISSNHHQIFFDVSLYPHSFFVNTPFKLKVVVQRSIYDVQFRHVLSLIEKLKKAKLQFA